MILGILKESHFNRVSLVPKILDKFKNLGMESYIEKSAGIKANFPDEDYENAGGQIKNRKWILENADILLSIAPIEEKEINSIKKGACYISLFEPFNKPEIIKILDKYPINALSLDTIPRITLAQSMDVLSSMASLSGYKAVLEASHYYGNMFPMMMTAAGTIPPTRVLVLGAGVAGLQAIATAKRLGAVVEAFDTRAAAKEEVESLGAKFIVVEGAKDDASAGGYAVEQSEEYLKRQRELVQEKAMKSNIIITTAQVRGRKAPLLVPKETIDKMANGSVLVDLAASTGGNCAYTEDNKVVYNNGITLIGNSNLADLLPEIASTLLSNNIFNFLKYWIKEGKVEMDEDTEIISSSLISKSN